ncbi:hypothetical protein SNE40_022647 [Patella caerulea]|uniref:VTT domain-containing protein n=1 Tax=Patella caerulea TaxID=87958 RepID=A0AAN8GFW9_PATCE
MPSIIWVPVIFALASYGLFSLSQNMPELTNKNETVSLKFPTNLEELTSIARILQEYKSQHLTFVYILFSSAYLYKQTFAIPGSVFMNILGGALFGTVIGFPLVCLLTAIGASSCFMLSRLFGKATIIKYFPEKLKYFQTMVKDNMESLFFFLLFLRFFPMSPNWFMNIVAPLLNIPLYMFFCSVFIGLMPYNFICIQTGCMLSELKSLDDMFTMTTAIKLVLVASVALVPGIIINRLKKNKLKLS